jgi:uncharacterized protein YkwD
MSRPNFRWAVVAVVCLSCLGICASAGGQVPFPMTPMQGPRPQGPVGGPMTGDLMPFQITQVEGQILELTNRERQRVGLPPLWPNPRLFAAARAHSVNMARHRRMDHTLDGVSPFRRIADAGYPIGIAGENVAVGYNTLVDLMDAWMKSAGHRQNILSPDYAEIGIGWAAGPSGEFYYTQEFGRQAPPRSWKY